MRGRFPARLGLARKTILMCLFLAPMCATPFCAASDWNYEETHSEAREFAAGGFVHVQLRVGDMHIRRGDSDKISLRYTVKARHERNVKDAHVDFEVRGTDATIEFRAPYGDNTQIDVELE